MRRRILAFFVFLLATTTACSDEPTGVSRLTPPEALAAKADTNKVRCPQNPYWTLCSTPTPAQRDIIWRAASSPPAIDSVADVCQAARDALRPAIENALYFPSGASLPAAYTQLQGAWTIIQEYLTWPAHVNNGNTRHAVYHEGSHILGYLDEPDPENPTRLTTYEFADLCRQSELGNVRNVDGNGGDPGDPTRMCLVRFWYCVDTGDVFKEEILYCWDA